MHKPQKKVTNVNTQSKQEEHMRIRAAVFKQALAGVGGKGAI